MASPLELLTADENRIPSIFETIWAPTLGTTLGFLSACFINWASRRPVFSGVQKHVLFAGIGGALGKYVDERRNLYLAERDAVLRRYVELHPEDFSAPDRKKFADVLLPWTPIR